MQSAEIDKLAGALAKAQGAIRGAEKDGQNPMFRSQYSTLDATWKACREPLSSNGLAVVQAIEYFDGVPFMVTTLMHESGQWKDSRIKFNPPTDVKGVADVQGAGSYITYLRRYQLGAIAGVAPTDDDDGEAASGRPKKQEQAQARPQQKPQPQQRRQELPPLDPAPIDPAIRHAAIQQADRFGVRIDELAAIESPAGSVKALDAWAAKHASELKALPDDLSARLRTQWKAAKDMAMTAAVKTPAASAQLPAPTMYKPCSDCGGNPCICGGR